MKLTPTQIKALRAMPFECVTWGGKPFTRPANAGTRSTWLALRLKGLARVRRRGFTDRWEATEAGREMLAARSK